MIGTIAAILTTVSFVPDALKAVIKKDVSGINLVMYGIFTTGVALWTAYGIATAQPSLYLANGITFAFAVTTLVTKLRLDVLPALGRRRNGGAQGHVRA